MDHRTGARSSAFEKFPNAEAARLIAEADRMRTAFAHGVGLGLVLSRGLTEAMGGTLGPEDTPGGGLTMAISLAAAPGPTPGIPRAWPA